jgi:DNA-binding transcriptional regulator YdaS (Cro superfamily)
VKQPEDSFTGELPLPLPTDEHGDVFIPSPGWRQALDAAVAADPRGKLGVSERLGVSRVYVSRVMTGSMPSAPAKFVERVTKTLMVVHCPHLQRALQPEECRAYAARTYSQVSQFEVAHWRACKGCAHNAQRQAGTLATGATVAASGNASHTTSAGAQP